MATKTDTSVIVFTIIQNQAYLRTLLYTQAKLLAKLEERDEIEVLGELLELVVRHTKEVGQQINELFPDFTGWPG